MIIRIINQFALDIKIYVATKTDIGRLYLLLCLDNMLQTSNLILDIFDEH